MSDIAGCDHEIEGKKRREAAAAAAAARSAEAEAAASWLPRHDATWVTVKSFVDGIREELKSNGGQFPVGTEMTIERAEQIDARVPTWSTTKPQGSYLFTFLAELRTAVAGLRSSN